jgi:hypothetical protein
MKRYSVSIARPVNKQASKTGVMFQYSGRTNNPDREIEMYNKCSHCWGIRIVDSQTKQVVFEHSKPVKGTLLITFRGKSLVDGKLYDEWTMERQFIDLEEMRKAEHHYRYEMFDVVKVDRIIHKVN